MAEILSFETGKRRRASKPTNPPTQPEVVIMPEIDMEAVKTSWANLKKMGKTHKPLRDTKRDQKD